MCVCVCELFNSDGWLNKHLIVQLQRQHDGSDFTCVCVCVCELFSSDGWLIKSLIVQLQRHMMEVSLGSVKRQF